MLSEADLQKACVAWFNRDHSNLIIYKVDNEGKREGYKGKEAVRLGILAGIPDLHIPEPVGDCPGLYVELKKPFQKIKLTPSQEVMIPRLRERGFVVEVCNHINDFKKIVNEYLGDNHGQKQ